MARVTIEDCINIINNRFELVVLASRRARDISAGSKLTIEKDNDKFPVIALREIAQNTINKKILSENLVSSYQDNSEYEANIITKPETNSEEAESNEKSTSKSSNEQGHKGVFSEDNLEIED